MRYLQHLFLSIPFILCSQTKTLDFEFFLYGLNYNHYTQSKLELDEDENQIDIFFDSLKEDVIATYLLKKIDKEAIEYAKIKRIEKDSSFYNERDDNLSQYYLYSKFIKKGLDKHFGDDFLTKQKQGFKFNNTQIYSFVSGAYARDGEQINDTIYKISSRVSKKPSYCYSLLKKTNSSNVFYKKTGKIKTEPDVYYNPISIVYFTPSKELKEYLSLVEKIPTKKERIKLIYSERYQEEISLQKTKKSRRKAIKIAKQFGVDFDNNWEMQHKKEIDSLEK